jgi:hypothetical protein
VIPAWVRVAPRAVADCHRIAHALRANAEFGVVEATVGWVTSSDPTLDDVHAVMDGCVPDAYGDTVRNTLAWLAGYTAIPPIRLPRRNPDGSVITPDQLCAEYLAGKTGLPEQRRDARTRAEQDAARYQRLAALADSIR